MSPLGLVVSIVLVDLLGFSLVMPLLAPFAKEYGFSPLQIGLLLAGYPMAQLVAGPILGRLSDRYGRRPVLAASQFGTAVSFLILGLSTDFDGHVPGPAARRGLGRQHPGGPGLCGRRDQARGAVAGLRADRHGVRPGVRARAAAGPGPGRAAGAAPDWRLRVPFLVAAGFSTVAWVLVLLRLPESLPADARARQRARVVSRRGLVDAFGPAGGRPDDRPRRAGDPGVRGAGGDVQPLPRRPAGLGAGRGPGRVHVPGAGHGDGPGGAGPPAGPEVRRAPADRRRPGPAGRWASPGSALAGGTAATLLATLLVGVGQGLVSPTISGLLSRITPEGEQGAVFGTLSSAQTLARMANYLVANLLFGRGNTAAPVLGGRRDRRSRRWAWPCVTLPTVRRGSRGRAGRRRTWASRSPRGGRLGGG